jgi:integrase
VKLDKDNVFTLASDKPDAIFFDDDMPGFGVRVRGEMRVYVCQFRIDGAQRRVTLGDVRKISLNDARKAARKHFAHAVLGGDPQAKKAEAAVKAKVTFASVADLYLAKAAGKLRPKSLHETTRYLKETFKPLHRLPVHKVERRDVAAQLSEIAARNGKHAADRGRSAVSAMFVWAMREGLCDQNPIIATNRHADSAGGRDRVLSDAEIARIWNVLPDGDYGRIMKLLVLTGLRREEVGGLRWSEIDLDKHVVVLPKERTKNKTEHLVPLSDSAIDVLRECPRRASRDLVFGLGAGPFQGYAVCKAVLDKAAPLERPWRTHDLRRTVATRMAELGVEPHVIEAILGHTGGHKRGVAGIYNRATYEAQKRSALTMWANHVTEITQGADRKVVPLRSGEERHDRQ